MIPDAIFDFLEPAIEWLILQLPVISFDCGVIEDVSGLLSWLGQFVDLGVASTVLGLVLATELTIWTVRALVWLWERIPLT